jgi:hypothetical protein
LAFKLLVKVLPFTADWNAELVACTSAAGDEYPLADRVCTTSNETSAVTRSRRAAFEPLNDDSRRRAQVNLKFLQSFATTPATAASTALNTTAADTCWQVWAVSFKVTSTDTVSAVEGIGVGANVLTQDSTDMTPGVANLPVGHAIQLACPVFG